MAIMAPLETHRIDDPLFSGFLGLDYCVIVYERLSSAIVGTHSASSQAAYGQDPQHTRKPLSKPVTERFSCNQDSSVGMLIDDRTSVSDVLFAIEVSHVTMRSFSQPAHGVAHTDNGCCLMGLFIRSVTVFCGKIR